MSRVAVSLYFGVCLSLVISLSSAKVDLVEVCKKYAEYVFINATTVGTETSLIDTCAFGPDVIIQTDEANPRAYPHLALIGFGNASSIQWLCSGSLISDKYVLAAAHCQLKNERPKWVKLGDYDIDSTEDDQNGLSKPVVYEIVEVVSHPEYRPPKVYNDIALLKLNSSVSFNEYIRPVCLQTDRQLSEPAISVGYGRENWGGKRNTKPKEMHGTIYSWKRCNESYNRAGSKLPNGIDDDSMLCFGDKERGGDACSAESGSPLMQRLSKPYCMHSLVGLSSFGIQCGLDTPGVYTRVSHFIPWIESVVWP